MQGYLFTLREHGDSRHDRDSLLDWVRPYSVLTSAGLDFRPTDQEPGTRPSRAFTIAECALVEDESVAELGAGGLRPFVVVLKDGRRKDFACESRGERVKWVSALQCVLLHLCVMPREPNLTPTSPQERHHLDHARPPALGRRRPSRRAALLD